MNAIWYSYFARYVLHCYTLSQEFRSDQYCVRYGGVGLYHSSVTPARFYSRTRRGRQKISKLLYAHAVSQSGKKGAFLKVSDATTVIVQIHYTCS